MHTKSKRHLRNISGPVVGALVINLQILSALCNLLRNVLAVGHTENMLTTITMVKQSERARKNSKL